MRLTPKTQKYFQEQKIQQKMWKKEEMNVEVFASKKRDREKGREREK
jgi:hypothetical protein